MALLLAGAAAAQNARIVLRWKEVPGASGYELQIARDAAFVEVVLQTRTPSPGYRWEQLPTTTHWWRVRSFDAESRPSEWSAPRTIAVDSAVPVGKRPADGAVLPCGAAVEFELDPSPLVKEYLVELSASADFATSRTLRAAAPLLEGGVLPTGTWWWRTRAIDVRGREAGPGPVRSFVVRVAAPKLKPVADVFLGTPHVALAWQPAGCARSYVVEATHDGKDRVSLVAEEPMTSFKAGVAGEYRWRVASVDERGTAHEFSPESAFRVRLPTPQPRAESIGATALLSWTPVPSAVSYRVELSRPADKAPLHAAAVAGTSWRSPELSPGAYQWRVSARDALGHVSGWSELRTFERSAEASLGTPTFAALQDDVVDVGAELELAWARVPDATRYEVELDGSPLPSVASAALRTPPMSEGPHRLRVRALGERGRASEWSEWLEVYAGVPPVAEARVEVLTSLLRVVLLDSRGRVVRGAAPRFFLAGRPVAEVSLRDGAWQLPWTPPASGRETLRIEERQASFERLVVLPLDAPFSLALRGGGLFSGSAVTSPTGHLAVTVRLPLWSRRPGVELRVGIYGAASALDVGGLAVEGRAALVPISALLAWHHDLGPVALKAGVGPALQLGWFTVGDEAALSAAPGVEAAVGVSRRLGPGRVELDVAGLYSRFETPLARLHAGGVGLRLGYAVDFGGER